MKKKLLLHTCCAPCLIYPLETLRKEFEITIFYYNPNIHPQEEYKLRLKTLRKYCFESKLNIITGPYRAADYYRNIKGVEQDKKKRCAQCYHLRLQRTLEQALRLKFKSFSTTLMISPYQDLKKIKEIAVQLAEKYRREFIGENGWPRHFREAQNKAKELGMYRQKYCGCTFSREEVK